MRYVPDGYYDETGKFHTYSEQTRAFLKAGGDKTNTYIAKRIRQDRQRVRPTRAERTGIPTPPHRQALGTAKTKRIRRSLERDYGNQCFYCKEHFDINDLQIEHMTPRSRGGTNELSNLTWACKPCNSDKGDMTVAEYEVYKALDKPERRKFNKVKGRVGLTHALSEYWPGREDDN